MNDITNQTKETVDERVTVTVRLLPETLKRLDAIRGARTRQHMIAGGVNAILSGKIDIPLRKPEEPEAIVVGQGVAA